MKDRLHTLFNDFLENEKSSGLLLIAAAIVAIAAANSPIGADWHRFWAGSVGGHSIEWWINDVLMTLFFLLVGLEIERELYVGELSSPRKAILPAIAALGGMVVPAALHFSLNQGLETARGFGIPMATDIAFTLGVLALLGKRVPFSLKVFITALAIMDDLGAIIVIAFAYSSGISWAWMSAAGAVYALMLLMNRTFHVMRISPYLVAGALLWGALHEAGVHATLAGVLTAFAVPFRDGTDESPSWKLEHAIHRIVAFGIVPLFALANAGIHIQDGWTDTLLEPNSAGILLGLIVGKPAGILLFCAAFVASGVAVLPTGVTWRILAGGGMLAGIGFTMAIFVALLAFEGPLIDASKMAVFCASMVSAAVGFVWLFAALPKTVQATDDAYYD